MAKTEKIQQSGKLKNLGTVVVTVRRFSGQIIAEYNASGTPGADVKFGLNEGYKNAKECVVALAQHLKNHGQTGVLKVKLSNELKTQ